MNNSRNCREIPAFCSVFITKCPLIGKIQAQAGRYSSGAFPALTVKTLRTAFLVPTRQAFWGNGPIFLPRWYRNRPQRAI